MSPAPKNLRRSAFLAVLLLVGALIVWRLGKPSPNVRATVPTPPPTATATSAEGTPGAGPVSADASALAERPSGPVKREGVDAANLYADAFVRFDQLTDAEKAMIRKPSEEVDAEQAAQLYEKIQAIMELLRAAAKADYCDWGIGEITFETGLPHINKAQDLAKLALWAAGYRFATDPTGAIDDLSVRAKLGHHLTDTLLGVLVAVSFERSANSLLQQHAGSMDAATLTASTQFIGGSTLDTDLTRAFRGELSAVESFGSKLASVEPLERGRMLWGLGGLVDGEKLGWLDSIKQNAAGFLTSPQRINDAVASIRGVHESAPDALRMPEADFQNWWANVERSMQGGDPLTKLAFPSLQGIQSSIQRLRVERTLFTAGADILQNGPAQLGRYRDPATGSPLQYVATSTGFELRSPYLAKGKPVTMTFSRP